MAKLSAYGRTKIAEFDTLCDRIAFMSDCTSLVNFGNGWKTGKKYESKDAMLAKIKAIEEEQSSMNPFWKQLKDEVHDNFALAYRHNVKRLLDEILECFITPLQASRYMDDNAWSTWQFNGKVLPATTLAKWTSLMVNARNYRIGLRFPQTSNHADPIY